MTTPSITPAQILAVAKFAVGFFVAQHYISAGQGRSYLELASIVLPGLLVLGDAAIRIGRSKIGLELAAQGWQRELRGIEQNKAVQESAKAAIEAALKELESQQTAAPAPQPPAVQA